MNAQNRLTSIAINVPYKSAGNSITQHEVSFDVYQDGEDYVLKPRLDESELRIANLPGELKFSMKDGKPESSRGAADGNFHVIQDAVTELKARRLIN